MEAAGEAVYFAHLDRKSRMFVILARAIREMYDIGASSADVAGTLWHAVGVLLDGESDDDDDEHDD